MARPKGSYTRPQIRQYLKQDKIDELTNIAYKKAKAGDTIMLKFLLEQIYGKAPQPITGEDGKAIKIQFDNAFASNTKENSGKPKKV